MLASARTYPHRPDTVETVGAALLAAASGCGYRQIAEQIAVPPTTVRGWLQRARTNGETVRADVTMAVHALDPNAGPSAPTGSSLSDVLEVIGRAVSATIRRYGPSAATPWQLAAVITAGGLLATRPTLRWHRIS